MQNDKKNGWYSEIKNWFKPEDPPVVEEIVVADHTFVGHIKVGASPLLLNGAGVRTVAGKAVYAVALYLPRLAKRADTINALIGPRRVELVILDHLNATDFVESLRYGIQCNTNETAKEFIKKELAELEEVMAELTNMLPGDVIEFDWIPKRGTFITYNDEVLGTPIRGKALNDAVVSIWTGLQTLDEPLREALLAGGPKEA